MLDADSMSLEDEPDVFEMQNVRRKPLVLTRGEVVGSPPSPSMIIQSRSLPDTRSSDVSSSEEERDDSMLPVDLSSPIRIPTRTPNKNPAFAKLKNQWESGEANSGTTPPRPDRPLGLSSPGLGRPLMYGTSPPSVITVSPPSEEPIQEPRMTKSAGAVQPPTLALGTSPSGKSKSLREKKHTKSLSHSSDSIMSGGDKILKEQAKVAKMAAKAGSEIAGKAAREVVKEKSKEEKEKMKEIKAQMKEEKEKMKEEKAREREEMERKEKERKMQEKQEKKLRKKEEKERERLEKEKEKEKLVDKDATVPQRSPNLTPSKKRPVFGRRKSFKVKTDQLDRAKTVGNIGQAIADAVSESNDAGRKTYILPDDEVEKQLNILNQDSDVITLQALPFCEDEISPLDLPYKRVIEGPNQNADPEFVLWPPDSGRGKYRVYGQTVSTYPRVLEIPGARQGDPVCDCFSVRCYDNGLIFCVCDGCGWGNSACTAAKVVRATFMKRLHESATQQEKKSIFDLANILLEVLAQAHNDIMTGKELWECGSTTVVAGFLLDMEKDGEKVDEQGLLMISIGDCKVYKLDCKDGSICDMTYGSRLNLLNPSDCGGRVGPTGEETKPDLRNLKLNFSICHKGDLLWVVSDGVHDNIDPQWMGLLPKDMERKELENIEKWSDDLLDKDQDLLATVKNDFSMNLLKILLSRGKKAKEAMAKFDSNNQQEKEEKEEKEKEKESDTDTASSDDEEDEKTSAVDLLKRYFASDSGDDYSIYALSSKRIATQKLKKEKADQTNSTTTTTTTTTTPSSSPTVPNKQQTTEENNNEVKQTGQAVLQKIEEKNEKEAVSNPDQEEGEEDDEGISPRTVTRALIRHALQVTSATRNFMENNPNMRQPEDLLNYPGKMDHTTCVAFRV